MKDFNSRSKSEAAYVDSPILSSDLDVFLQELDILFNTEEYEVYGNHELGMSLERFLGKFSINSSQVRTLCVKQIQNNCYMQEYFNWEVKSDFVQGNVRDILMLSIIIKDKFTQSELKKITYIYR